MAMPPATTRVGRVWALMRCARFFDSGSATKEELLAAYGDQQQQARLNRQQEAAAAVSDWNNSK